jgi:hypothetical protein
MHVNKGIQMCIQIQLLPALIIFYVSFMHDTKSFIFANCPISWYILETPSWILLPVHTTRNNYFPFLLYNCTVVCYSVILLSVCSMDSAGNILQMKQNFFTDSTWHAFKQITQAVSTQSACMQTYFCDFDTLKP